MIRHAVAALAVRALVALANPRREPLKTCGSCGAGNEPGRSKCRNCGASV